MEMPYDLYCVLGMAQLVFISEISLKYVEKSAINYAIFKLTWRVWLICHFVLCLRF